MGLKDYTRRKAIEELESAQDSEEGACCKKVCEGAQLPGLKIKKEQINV